jgi:hypothetical protein
VRAARRRLRDRNDVADLEYGEVVPLSRAHGRFRLRCERGALEFVAFLTPVAPPVIQMIEWRQELLVGDGELANARRVVAALNGTAPLAPELLAPGADRARIERRLARWHAVYGSCVLDRSLWNDGQGAASVRLRCTSDRRIVGAGVPR